MTTNSSCSAIFRSSRTFTKRFSKRLKSCPRLRSKCATAGTRRCIKRSCNCVTGVINQNFNFTLSRTSTFKLRLTGRRASRMSREWPRVQTMLRRGNLIFHSSWSRGKRREHMLCTKELAHLLSLFNKMLDFSWVTLLLHTQLWSLCLAFFKPESCSKKS